MQVSEQQVRRTFAPTPLASLQPCSAKQEPDLGARTLLWLPARGPECAVATAWPCPVQQAQPWGPGGALMHPKRWHLSSWAVPPGPVTLWGFIPRAGMGQPKQNQAIRCRSGSEKIPASQGLQWWEDSSLRKGSHKLQPWLRALPQPVPVPCCPQACEPSTGQGS